MTVISSRQPEVTIEYGQADSRKTKDFTDAYVARRFYVSQVKLGTNPVVRSKTMSQELNTVAAAAEGSAKEVAAKSKKTAKKVPVKKAAKKTVKAAKPAKKAAKKTEGEFGVERSHDVPFNDKKVAVFKALKSLKALDQTTAKSAGEIAEKAGLTGRDVRHYCYHAKAAGLVGVADVEGVHGYSFYLTKKGAAIDPVKAQKEGI